MNIQRRLRALELRIDTGFVTLHMADGSTRQVRSNRLLKIVGEMFAPTLGEDARAVADSVNDDCPATGNGDLVQFARVMYAARVATDPCDT